MSDRARTLEQYTRVHVDALNRLVRACEDLEAPHLEVPPWEDGPPDFDGSEAPKKLKDALALGLEWQKYAESLHDMLEEHAKHFAHLPALSRDAREALIVFEEYHPAGAP